MNCTSSTIVGLLAVPDRLPHSGGGSEQWFRKMAELESRAEVDYEQAVKVFAAEIA
jgi:hypothetical protein